MVNEHVLLVVFLGHFIAVSLAEEKRASFCVLSKSLQCSTIPRYENERRKEEGRESEEEERMGRSLVGLVVKTDRLEGEKGGRKGEKD